ncbi:hypothetical protein PYCH_00350 [Pyrococcus yayanosii CH1]|uniref:Uncharacterized protein n=1 Tax=Pyrococcus yayanosii (strain CH1 / JCM 16557) TaxID=529709 RepID=F8AFE1_PYRYC|nr:hypothetical protein PYCH_00350 [Pyrococcus yayanosii CH1]
MDKNTFPHDYVLRKRECPWAPVLLYEAFHTITFYGNTFQTIC